MNVFLTGVSGYIGGTVAQVLIRAGHKVRGLVRTAERASQLIAAGIEPVIGDLSNSPLLALEARAADAVANCADSDDRHAVEVLLGALAGTGRPFVHTSGVTVLADCGGGSLSDRVHDERSDFRLWSPRKDRVDIDNLVLCSAASGVSTSVLCAPLLYGAGLGLTRRGGIEKTLLTEAKQGTVGYVGKGTNRWSTVHIVDFARLFLQALENSVAGEFFFVENGEIALGELSRHIATHTQGATAISLDMSTAIERWGESRAHLTFGSNCRVNASLARQRLKWTPGEAGIFESIEQESSAD